MFSSFSDEDDERIKLQLQDKLCDLFVDPVQMEQVLHNLLENALKYSTSDKIVEVEVNSCTEEATFKIMDRLHRSKAIA